MPAAGDLDRVRGIGADAFGIRPGRSRQSTSISPMATQPGRGGAVGQQVDRCSRLHVHHDGAVDVASAECEVVDTENGYLPGESVGYRPHCSQQGVPVDGDTESAGIGCRPVLLQPGRSLRSSLSPPVFAASTVRSTRRSARRKFVPRNQWCRRRTDGPDIDQDRRVADRGVGRLPMSRWCRSGGGHGVTSTRSNCACSCAQVARWRPSELR